VSSCHADVLTSCSHLSFTFCYQAQYGSIVLSEGILVMIRLLFPGICCSVACVVTYTNTFRLSHKTEQEVLCGGNLLYFHTTRIKKEKVIPVTGLGGLYGCEMLRIPHCLDNRFTDGGKVSYDTYPKGSP
jgi:hypothetical protein